VARGHPLSFGISENYIIEIGINSTNEFVASATRSITTMARNNRKRKLGVPERNPHNDASRKSGDSFSANLHNKPITCILLYATISNGGVISSLPYNACLVGAALCEVVVREGCDEDQIY
jgi:hypothetical protein